MMRKQKKSTSCRTNVTIYHQVLDLEFEYSTTYFLITEIEDCEPHITYLYKIPDSYKDNRLLGELHERYSPYCPN